MSALNLKIHPDSQNTSYSAEEEDDSGIHIAYYDINERNSTNLQLTKKWSSDDYREHADGRPAEGERHSKSHYHTSLEIENGAIKNARRSHFSYLHSDKPYNRPLNKPEFQEQPDLELKASGESHLNLIRCIRPHNRRAKRSSEKFHSSLKHLKQDTLSYGGMQNLKWSSVGDPNKPSRTFYELLRCYSDRSVKKSELSQCVKELHHLAKIDDEVYKNIVHLTLARSHLNFTTWSGLVGSIVVRGDYQTQKILSQVIVSKEPRPLSKKEHAALLEAVYFIPAGPLYPELLQALLFLHKNSTKSDEISVRAMLVTTGLVRRSHDAGYNRSLSESVAQHLHQSFKTHPARLHDRKSTSHDEYIWSHVCAFGNLGHISSLKLITRYLDHDSSDIRYFAVSALRKLPTQHTDHHLLRILRNDEHVTVKAGVIEVFIGRRQNITDELRDAIEDALWISEEGDELDSKITEFLENHNVSSFQVIQKLRERRSTILRKKRALIPALKPREFSLGVGEEWRKAFGGRRAGAEAIMRFVNKVKLRIGIFGGSFEVNLDNLARFRAHVIIWSFDIINGKAAFRMGAGFKNDIPKDIIHIVADAADSVLAKVDAISSIVAQLIEKFLDILKNNLPFKADGFVSFIDKTVDFISRTTVVKNFAESFDRIVKNLQSAWRASDMWLKIDNLIKKLSLSLSQLNLSKSFGGAFRFLNKLLDLFSGLQSKLPHNFPLNFNIRKFMMHISRHFRTTYDAVESYFETLGFRFPEHFFDMFHFNVMLKFIPSLNGFKITTSRLLHFANSFLEMLSLFQNMFNIALPRLGFSEFNIEVDRDKEFDFSLPFDWRFRFNFDIRFSGPDFAIFKNLFRLLAKLFLNLSTPNINFEQFFEEILPNFRIAFEKEEIFQDIEKSNSRLKFSSTVEWLKLVVKIFQDFSAQFNSQFFDLSNTKEFLDALSKSIGDFAKHTFENVCTLQDFILKSAGKLEIFGDTLEKDTILEIKHVKNYAHQAIREVHNITLFVDQLIEELKTNVSGTAKIFVEKYLTELEGSLENVKQLADITKVFSSKSANKLTGICYKTVDISGDLLDKIQSEAQNAVNDVAEFFTDNSDALVTAIGEFKNVVKELEYWYDQNLAKHVGKVSIISKSIDEFLSMIKTEKGIFSDIHKVFANINNVIEQLNNLPMHAQQAYGFADKITDFVTNGKNWETKVRELNIGRVFKLDFDEQLRKLCDKFHSFAEDNIEQINSDNLFKKFRELVTKETDHIILQTVGELNVLKTPLKKARSNMDEMYKSVEEIEAILIELRPFSRHFSPVLQEISRLPNCSDIHFIFSNIITKCGKETISFGKNAYNDYITLKSEITAFLELLPDEWESLHLQKCISGGTCLSHSLKKQAESVSTKMETLKKKFSEFTIDDKLETCKKRVEQVSQIFDRVKNISKLVLEFSQKEEIIKIKDLSRRITGKHFGNDDNHDSRVSSVYNVFYLTIIYLVFKSPTYYR